MAIDIILLIIAYIIDYSALIFMALVAVALVMYVARGGKFKA